MLAAVERRAFATHESWVGKRLSDVALCRKGEAMTPHAPRTTAKVAPPKGRERGDFDARLGLTRAEAHALRRSAPLTPAQFKELRRLAEHGVNPLRRI
ncbi:MAG TPA: hypothetical protein VGO81_16125 [Solirubrobacteraceae bacterium]|nr:hypothetical protein [Solirubrobacteraceae bacterium]